MNVALCKCGIDMTEHRYIDGYDDFDSRQPMPESEHVFVASGTKYRCEKILPTGFMCARPAYHNDDKLACGPMPIDLSEYEDS